VPRAKLLRNLPKEVAGAFQSPEWKRVKLMASAEGEVDGEARCGWRKALKSADYCKLLILGFFSII